ncbi:hypothetical protein VCHA32P90_80184 [Vibrio chagasii]|nr:hypothetical protein VCHA32P90_80184 [Vibrio chagasii]CAH7362948.1 hypothetical protein VCHA53O469_70184 [Vibrio chagasii]CAH7377158.1 hypothetical protein VCHA39P230_80033 [Vibrio chagasii]CAH7470818.1 hypothetical protein VCHA55O506_80033 [Vibrio chagasii]
MCARVRLHLSSVSFINICVPQLTQLLQAKGPNLDMRLGPYLYLVVSV